MTGLLSGRMAFVTGGGSGIGQAAARAMAAQGAIVTVADLAGADITVAAIAAAGGQAFAITLDVTDQGAVDAAIDGAVARHGRLDIAFNNAGINIENKRAAWDDIVAFDRTVAVNQRGVMLCMIAELRHMARQRSGSIINTASVASFKGITGPGYTASKHAVVGLTRAAAVRYAEEGVRINAICPGATQTGMMAARHDEETRKRKAREAPMNRIAEPEEIAATVVFLASDQASYMTGHALAVDGGMMAW